MLRGFLRVASRAVAIQLEEAAAGVAVSRPYDPARDGAREGNAVASGSGSGDVATRKHTADILGPQQEIGQGGLRDERWLRSGQVFRHAGSQVGLVGGRTPPFQQDLPPDELSRLLPARSPPAIISETLSVEPPKSPAQPAVSQDLPLQAPTPADAPPTSDSDLRRAIRAASQEADLDNAEFQTPTLDDLTSRPEEGVLQGETTGPVEPAPESSTFDSTLPIRELDGLPSEAELTSDVAASETRENAGIQERKDFSSDTQAHDASTSQINFDPTADLAAAPVANSPVPETSESTIDVESEPSSPVPTLRPSRVPSSRIGRLFHYGSLVAGLSMGAATEYVRRSTGGGNRIGADGKGESSVFMSEANVRRLVGKLGKMRGAALKLGQFMSIQDTNVLPEQLERVLQQVQAQADYMPEWQMDKVMRSELGSAWQDSFSSFERVPIASASIGQVHRGVLASTGQTVAVKIQFPGIQESISSDLDNLSLLLRTSALLPRGLYLDNTLKVMRGELADECDYVKEAENGRRMKAFLKDEEFFEVPEVVKELTTGKVLTTEMMSGKPLSQIKGFSQELRDKIGSAVLRLCLLELFRFRLMQTDPNWANFLYDKGKDKLQLIDFGATREYSVTFMDQWYRLLKAVIDGDREGMRVQSQAVGYLTGEENEEMVNAHLRSMELLAVPFLAEEYDFSKQSVTDEVRTLIPTMLKHRLTPPPNETYSLNRKLSGSFLLCAKLGSKVRCRDMWEEVVAPYKVST